MSDDLVMWLRGLVEVQVGDVPVRIHQAADRIEELEAKLAKALEGLTRIEDLTCHNMPMTAREEQCVNHEARAAIAELKG